MKIEINRSVNSGASLPRLELRVIPYVTLVKLLTL